MNVSEIKRVKSSNYLMVFGAFYLGIRLNHYVKEFIVDRIEEVYRKVLLNNKRYLELTSQIIQVQHELLNNLPPGLQPLVNRYDEAEAEQGGLMMSLMYRQGFFDGAKAVRMIRRRN